MLAIIERYFNLIRDAKSDEDIAAIIRLTAEEFGYRSGFLLEYHTPYSSGWRALESDPAHFGWWPKYFASPFVVDNPRLQAVLKGPEIVVFDSTRWGPQEAEIRKLAAAGDMLESTMIPLGYEGRIVGALGFRGVVKLTSPQQNTLQMIAHSLFAQFRALQKTPLPVNAVGLTPRERQVIRLSADGMTSLQIATQLGMSARTANQHFDNIADKLGTRNRAHTVAEVIRRGLLD